MKYFGRTYQLIAGKAGKEGFQIGHFTDGNAEPLHISFAIERADKESDNTAKVSIWNLNQEHLDILYQKDCVVAVRAGYGSVMPLVFSGIVTYAETVLDNADRVTNLELTDNKTELRDSVVSVSFSGKVSSKVILLHVADQLGVSVTIGTDVRFKDVADFAFIGTGGNAIAKLCGMNGLKHSVQNGVLQITTPGSPISKQVYLISPDTGLVGSPSRFTEAATDTEKAKSGWVVEVLMNAALNIGDYVRLECENAKGYFRVSKIAIEGDTADSVWQCTLTLEEE